ncbi:MAG: hypothetical protein A2137_05335 [Chloroflexi bacterium RBG_16_58_8]|nr:MAG: hypothetical protein A2137_05335 [Chloroflexi bacterium RBG_16_58_8]
MLGLNTITALKEEKAGRFRLLPLADEARAASINVQKFEKTAKLSEAALYQGDVLLAVTPLVSFRQVDVYLKRLAAAVDAKLVSRSWSEEEGLTVTISIQTPVALTSVIEGMPEVAEVRAGGKKHGEKKLDIILNNAQETGTLQN